ncbi:class I SAM-dependent methyltransferase [Micromonospora krabiensis]|uniref:Methyltransferase domain-containing protein n=1 Tax=Micromonospora krabiensis TaxID=307121 RepID=A0A1C3MX95_9ACTN|nr:class I SAM-dependent methyltransferase [Micromonospora krabiensis]SBV24935.1 Methyltransferase domain-containing protein [Micromonospora krabiensis]
MTSVFTVRTNGGDAGPGAEAGLIAEHTRAGGPPVDGGRGFAAALRSRGSDEHWLVYDDGARSRLPARRWHGPPEPATAAVVARCAGPTLDLGCGPGRLTLALARAGVTAIGVDVNAYAVATARARGAVAIHRDVFEPLPGEGRWAHAILLDGNIGIGGDPVALLRRCRALLDPAGTVLVELEPPGPGLWQGHARIATTHRTGRLALGPLFRWARLDTRAVHHVAPHAGFAVREILQRGGRWFGELNVSRPGPATKR